jgi:hypothetical protein
MPRCVRTRRRQDQAPDQNGKDAFDPGHHEIGEQADLGVAQAAVLAEDGQLNGQRWRGRGHGNQRAAAQVIGDLEDGFQNDAMPVQRPLRQHVAIIRFEGAGDLKTPQALRGLQGPLKLFRAGKAQVQTIVPVGQQRIAILGQAATRDIGGGGAEQARAICHKTDFQRAVFQLAQMEGQIQPFGGDIDHPVGQAQAQIDLRVGGLESRHMRGNDAPPDAKRGGHEQRAARILGDVAHGGLGLGDGLQHLQRAVIKQPPVFGGLQAARRAVEQAHAKVLFQLRDSRRGHGGRGALITRCRTHAAQFIDTDEHLERGDVRHGVCGAFF